jgi:GDP-D-mannose dehydratase
MSSFRIQLVNFLEEIYRGFNYESTDRSHKFVNSTIVRRCFSLNFGELDGISISNVSVFEDWSHVEDMSRMLLMDIYCWLRRVCLETFTFRVP